MIQFTGVRESITIKGQLRPELVTILNLASLWSNKEGVVVFITSINDHEHMENSLHGEDLAVDLDTQGNLWKDLIQLHAFLLSHAGPGYDVIRKPTHVHVEFDTRWKGANVS